jgi:hypothetical protein
MEIFNHQQPSMSDIQRLNRCQLYLQVLTVSDIASADGLYITLPNVKLGQKLSAQIGNLEWPNQGNPSKADWQLWRSALASLEQHNKLHHPLGQPSTMGILLSFTIPESPPMCKH